MPQADSAPPPPPIDAQLSQTAKPAPTAKKAVSATIAPPVAPEVVANLFPEQPGLPKALQKLRLGMTQAEAAPTKNQVDLGSGLIARLVWRSQTKRLRQVVIRLPQGGADALAKRWGPPSRGTYASKRRVAGWFNATSGIQGILNIRSAQDIRLTISAFTPAAGLVGTLDGRFGFEAKHAVLGRTVAEIKADFPGQVSQHAQQLQLLLPPYEFQTGATRIKLTVKDQRVHAARLRIDFTAHRPTKAVLLQALAPKFGAIKGDRTVATHGERPKFEVLLDDATRHLTITATLP